MKFLIFGDVVGAIGREGISRALADVRDEYAPDSIIANVENIAHGKGITPDSMKEALTWDADAFTTGDHAWDNKPGYPLLDDDTLHIVRPANYPAGVPGKGYTIFTKGAYSVAVINLQGQLGFKNSPSSPFETLDELLQLPDIAACSIILIDFHAEFTSEKRAFGWYADGRVSAVWGTHTHIPTADEQILPGGTGFIADVGMNGGHHSILGMNKNSVLKSFRTQLKEKLEPPEKGPVEINALFVDINSSTSKTDAIAHVRKIIHDKDI